MKRPHTRPDQTRLGEPNRTSSNKDCCTFQKNTLRTDRQTDASHTRGQTESHMDRQTSEKPLFLLRKGTYTWLVGCLYWQSGTNGQPNDKRVLSTYVSTLFPVHCMQPIQHTGINAETKWISVISFINNAMSYLESCTRFLFFFLAIQVGISTTFFPQSSSSTKFPCIFAFPCRVMGMQQYHR